MEVLQKGLGRKIALFLGLDVVAAGESLEQGAAQEFVSRCATNGLPEGGFFHVLYEAISACANATSPPLDVDDTPVQIHEKIQDVQMALWNMVDFTKSGVVDEMEYVYFYIAMQQAVQKSVEGNFELPTCTIIEDAQREFKRDCSLVGAHKQAQPGSSGLVRRHFMQVFLDLPREVWITLGCLDTDAKATCGFLYEVQKIMDEVSPQLVLGVLKLQRAWRCSQARNEANRRREQRVERKRLLRLKWQQQKKSMVAKQFMSGMKKKSKVAVLKEVAVLKKSSLKKALQPVSIPQKPMLQQIMTKAAEVAMAAAIHAHIMLLSITAIIASIEAEDIVLGTCSQYIQAAHFECSTIAWAAATSACNAHQRALRTYDTVNTLDYRVQQAQIAMCNAVDVADMAAYNAASYEVQAAQAADCAPAIHFSIASCIFSAMGAARSASAYAQRQSQLAVAACTMLPLLPIPRESVSAMGENQADNTLVMPSVTRSPAANTTSRPGVHSGVHSGVRAFTQERGGDSNQQFAIISRVPRPPQKGCYGGGFCHRVRGTSYSRSSSLTSSRASSNQFLDGQPQWYDSLHPISSSYPPPASAPINKATQRGDKLHSTRQGTGTFYFDSTDMKLHGFAASLG